MMMRNGDGDGSDDDDNNGSDDDDVHDEYKRDDNDFR
jgi:hypothetical protein